MADFTYIRTAEGWLYVAAVIDARRETIHWIVFWSASISRCVVGGSMKAEMTAQLVTNALVIAI